MLPAVLLAVVYLIWAPPSADLAAQAFRVELFERHGFEVFSTAWYGGIHLPGYSLLFPPLAALLGERLVGALASVAATFLFRSLVRPRYGSRATVAISLFGLGSATMLFTGRLTFALGTAVALAAALALERRRFPLAVVLSALSSVASPVAGLFLAFAGAVVLLRGRARDGLLLAAPALVAILVVSLAFPAGGVEPFAGNTFVLITTATLLFVFVLPREEHTLRVAAVLHLGFCVVLFLADTPVGGNATRLGALMAAPLLALGAWGKRPVWLVAAALVPLIYWQWVAPVRDLSDAVGKPAVERHYFTPLVAELERRAPEEAYRVHVPPTRNRWEARFVAGKVPLARGWLRQAESEDFETFADGNLTPDGYREWLDERAVAFIAIPRDAEADYLAEDEIELVRSGLPYLDRVWATSRWELYEVARPRPIAPVPLRLRPDGFELEPDRPGPVPVAVRFSPYFRIAAGDACVRRDGEWTEVEAHAARRVRVVADLSAGGVAGALTGKSEICSE